VGRDRDGILDEHKKGRPVLVGTVSIEKSERISAMLDRRGLKRGTTTGGGAEKHVSEREVSRAGSRVRRAGRPPGVVTIATNMAGRAPTSFLAESRVHGAAQCLAEEKAERLPKGESGSSRTSSTRTSSTSTRSTGSPERTTNASISTSSA